MEPESFRNNLCSEDSTNNNRWLFTVATKPATFLIPKLDALPVSSRTILVFFSHVRLNLQAVSFLQVAQPNPYILLSFPCARHTCD